MDSERSEVYSLLLIITVLIRFINLITSITLVILKKRNKLDNMKTVNDSKTIKFLTILKEKSGFIFKVCVSIVLILVFNPRHKHLLKITIEEKTILFLYGLLSLIELLLSLIL
jgi:hypothetical protein